LISSVTGHSLPKGSVFFGEIGLSGQIRPVAHSLPRLKEAAKLGFTRALVPATAQEVPDSSEPRSRTARADLDRESQAEIASEIRADICTDVASLVATVAAPSRREVRRG
jgi:DNA repair protein RadA/Sms